MERIREGRRGNLAAVNGLSRRRPRSGSLRDSPEEDGGTELQETGRFRDRGSRKDRDRDRSTRSKRRRGDRLLHGGNRDEGDDSTDESIDDDEEDDGEDAVPAIRLPPPPPPPPFSHPSSPPVTLSTNHNPRKIFPSKVMRPPPAWKAADEMIGVPVPRKARSAHAKRPHECLPSGSGVGGEQVHRQTSSSPSRSSQASATAAPSTPISPSSSNAPIRKKTKQINCAKQRPPKISKSTSSIQEIEIEVAEVLYGLTRQFQETSKNDDRALDSKEANGSCNETKSRASSPACLSPRAASQSQSAILPHAPKRKRPRPVKYVEESSTSPSNRSVPAANASVSSTSKIAEGERPKADIPSPKSEKTTTSSPAENGGVPANSRAHPPEDAKQEEMATAELETSVHSNEHARGSDGNSVAATSLKPVSEDDRYLPGGKFQIDLMAPPPGKSSPDTEPDFVVEDTKPSSQYVERTTKFEFLKTEEGSSRYDRAVLQEARKEDTKSEKVPPPSDASLEIEKGEKVRIGGGKHPTQKLQQSKPTKSEPRPDRSAGVQSGPVPLPMSVAGWPGGLPFGYVGQVPSLPAIVPVDGSAAAAKALQQLRPRRCATHCYIAQNIYYQQLTRMNPFWPAKPYNLNVMPGAAEHVFPSRAQDGKSPVGVVPGQVSKEKPVGFPDATSQRKQQQPQQLVLQQPLQAGAASNNILPAPAFIFPINQPTAAGSSAGANRAVAPDASAGPPAAGGFNYGSLSQGEAQYLVLQNHGYPFPIPAHVGAPPYRGAAQALPFFNGSLYASQILHPSQLQQQPPPPQGHQNASNSTGSSSSQKHNSQKADPAESHLPQKRPPPRQMEGETGGGDSPSSVDSRISHKGGLYGHNFVMPLNPQNLALMALGADKSQQQHASSSQPPPLQQPQQQQGMKVDLAPSQAFAMSFASFNGAVAAAAAAAAASGQPHALDFSSAAQNQAIFQSLPEAARQAYQVQQKKSQHQQILPDSKSLAGSMNSAGDDARKTVLVGKASSSRGNSIDGSSTRVMNMMNGGARTGPSRSDAAAPPASSSSSTSIQQRQQQHLLQLQKQQQHHPQLPMQQQQLASRVAKGGAAAFADHHRMPGGAAMAKLPSALSGIPQALVQGNSHSPAGSPQWKDNASSRSSSAMPSPPANPPGAPSKSAHLQGRTAPSPQSQQISFGVRPPPAAAAVSAAGPVASPASSAAKSMSGSPRASLAAAKMVVPPGSASQSKGPVSGGHGRNNGKSPSPSILGQPHIATSPGTGMKQPQQQSQKQQAFTPPQIFFANSYLQQQQQQQPGPPHSLTLGGAAVGAASDSQAKTAPQPNNGMKGIPFMSAAGFPYFHGMSSVPVKPAEPKPAAGS